MTLRFTPFQQSDGFARMCALIGIPVRRGTRQRNGTQEARWLIQSRRIAWMGTVDLVSRGPVLHPGAQKTDVLCSLTRTSHRPLILNAPGDFAPHLKQAGFWPLMTPASLAILPLTDPVKLRKGLTQKWRNRLCKAETAGLTLRISPLDTCPDHWLLDADAAQARNRRYRGWPAPVTRAFAAANPGDALLFDIVAPEPVAAMLFVRTGSTVTYHAGVTTPIGRRLNAHTWIMWQAIHHFAASGGRVMDLGTVDDGLAPGLSRFKRGTGAQVVPLGGTWLRHPRLAGAARRLPARLAA